MLDRSTLGTSRNKRTERGSAQNTEGLENLGNWRETKLFRSIAFFLSSLIPLLRVWLCAQDRDGAAGR